MPAATTTNAGGGSFGVFYAKNVTGGIASVSGQVDNIVGTRVTFAILEYSGLDTASPLDATSTQQNTTGTTIDTGTATTTIANELLFSGAYDYTTGPVSANWTVSSGWVKRESPTGGGGNEAALTADRIVSSAGAYSNTFGNFPTGDRKFSILASFKSANLAAPLMSNTGAVSSSTGRVKYRLSVPSSQPPGTYTTLITYTVLGTF